MAWTATFNQDTGVDSVGTVVATYTDANNISTQYFRRVDTNDGGDTSAFVNEATQYLNKIQSVQVAVASVNNKITTSIVNELSKTPPLVP